MAVVISGKSGAVLVTVIILTIFISIIVIGLMGLSVSQVRFNQALVDEIKAEYLAKGQLYFYHQQMARDGSAMLSGGLTELDGKPFFLTAGMTSSGGPHGTDLLQFDVAF